MRNEFQHAIFLIRKRYLPRFNGLFKKFWLRILGMRIGDGTSLQTIRVNWPHQVSIGDNCRLETGISFKHDGIWSPGPIIKINDNVFLGENCEFNITIGIDIGNNCLIASGCRFIDHNHSTAMGTLIRKQLSKGAAITIGDDVWIGCNAVILKGVEIGNGAVVAAGSVVTKSVPCCEIWGGVPAKKIGHRR